MYRVSVFLGIAALLVIVGCDKSPDAPDVIAKNIATLAGPGEAIGTLPDGRKVVRYCINRGDHNVHWLYVTNGSTTLNDTGKSGVTESIIDAKNR